MNKRRLNAHTKQQTSAHAIRNIILRLNAVRQKNLEMATKSIQHQVRRQTIPKIGERKAAEPPASSDSKMKMVIIPDS
jgi:hypothetical protein